jgi:dTDP-4-dehydrorhamnose 3,5-epimerase
VFVPRGCAHGFSALSDNTIVQYKVDNPYNKESEGGIIYNDPTLNIKWRVSGYLERLSEKDLVLPTFLSL